MFRSSYRPNEAAAAGQMSKDASVDSEKGDKQATARAEKKARGFSVLLMLQFSLLFFSL